MMQIVLGIQRHRLLMARAEARAESRAAVLAAAQAIDRNDEAAFDTERIRIRVADARIECIEGRIAAIAVTAAHEVRA